MEIINLNGKKLAVGFEWEIIPKDISRKLNDELRDIAKKNNCSYGLSFTYDDTTAAAFSDKKTNVVSGALLLSLAQQDYLSGIDRSNKDIRKDWIVIEKYSEDGYWFSVFKDGVPTPSFDIITNDFGLIRENLDNLLKIDTFIIKTKLTEVIEFLEESGHATPVEQVSFEDITGLIDNKTIKKIGKLKKLVGIPQQYIIIAGAVVATGIFFFAFDTILNELKKRELQAKRAQAQSAAKLKEEAEYKARVLNYYKAFYTARDKALQDANNYIAQDALNTAELMSSYANFNVPTNGWDIASVSCKVTDSSTLNDKILCIKKFKKGTNTTNKMLIDAEPTAFMKSPTAIEAFAEKKFAYPTTNASLATYNFISLDDFSINYISKLQLLKYSGISLELKDAPQEIIFTPPALPLTKEEIEKGVKPAPTVPLKIGYAKGIFNLTGKGYSKYVELTKGMEWSSISLSGTEFTYSTYFNPSWKADFSYILKTKADNLEPPNIGKYTPSDFNLNQSK